MQDLFEERIDAIGFVCVLLSAMGMSGDRLLSSCDRFYIFAMLGA